VGESTLPREIKWSYTYMFDDEAGRRTHTYPANPGEGHKVAHVNTMTCKSPAAMKRPKT
jgi:hypothetical protein